ncbi:MAG: SipW-dependent-type signal peptide-containing protein [Clostridiales bacterium]|nr:SipW-dependent-type signal peptide-containing protein [Clostridiales bacterium]
MNKKKIAFLVIIIVALILIVSSTIAYLTDKKDTQTNTITLGSVKINLIEPNWHETDEQAFDENISEDPTIENVGNNSAYVFIKVSIPIIAGEEKIKFINHNGEDGINADSWSLLGTNAIESSEVPEYNINVTGYAIQTSEINGSPIDVYKSFDSNYTNSDSTTLPTNGTKEYVFYYGKDNKLTSLTSGQKTEALFNNIQLLQ